MKRKTRKLTTLLLALVMALTLLPVTAMAENWVTSVDITYDPSALLPLTPEMTGAQVSWALWEAVEESAGDQAYVDLNYSYLVKKEGDGFSSLLSSTEPINTADEHYFCFNVEEANGYQWNVNQLPSVTVNGASVPAELIRWDWQNSAGHINVYVPVPRVFITSHPQNCVTITGGSFSFVVEAVGTGLTYQWQVYTQLPGQRPRWSSWVGSSPGPRLDRSNVSSEMDGLRFRCVVTDSSGASVASNAAKLTVIDDPNPNVPYITSQPADVTVTAGARATFTVAAAGARLSYQWQVKAPGGSWKNSGASSAKTDTLSFNTTAAQNGYKYRCMVTVGSGVSVVSIPATLTVRAAGVTITTQPASVTVASGGKATFSVIASGSGLTYQWQVKTPNGDWKNSGASSAKTASLSFNATAAQNGYKYRCVVTNSDGDSATSSAATLTVGAGVTITHHPANVTVAAGAKATFKVAATGSGLTYQWQYLAPGGSWKNSGASSAKTATLSFNANAGQNGYKYRCVVKNSGGASVTSNAATLTVGSSSAPSITTQPANATVAAGAKATFKVAATGSGLTYQWQYLAPGGSWKNSGASSAKTATLSFNATAAQNGYKYRCIVKDSSGASVTSSAATLTVR